MNRGFTVVEVLVTLVVIGILLGLGTVGLRSSLANARDSERRADIETIARGLEQRYNKGSSYTWNGGSATHPRGTYPGNNEMWDLLWHGRPRTGDIFPGASDASVRAPSGESINSVCFFYWAASVVPACDTVENPARIQEFFADGSGGWKDRYLYEFIGPNNTYCNVNECTRYNLYWISETATTNIPSMGIPGLQVWRSKHQ